MQARILKSQCPSMFTMYCVKLTIQRVRAMQAALQIENADTNRWEPKTERGVPPTEEVVSFLY